mmetsp:Transcript_69912/g.169196  ORF Transcript_69912/g.169196 Transcript_69912/m.169196 type:complete len:238 (+) Transcript_69912:266-979(+)
MGRDARCRIAIRTRAGAARARMMTAQNRTSSSRFWPPVAGTCAKFCAGSSNRGATSALSPTLPRASPSTTRPACPARAYTGAAAPATALPRRPTVVASTPSASWCSRPRTCRGRGATPSSTPRRRTSSGSCSATCASGCGPSSGSRARTPSASSPRAPTRSSCHRCSRSPGRWPPRAAAPRSSALSRRQGRSARAPCRRPWATTLLSACPPGTGQTEAASSTPLALDRGPARASSRA